MSHDLQLGQRYLFVDALRGVAALAVLLHHLVLVAMSGGHGVAVMGPALRLISEAASHGVELFFVISGFVIAHSLRRHRSSASEVWRFVVRRQVRLDPVYWAVIVLALLLSALQGWLWAVPGKALPSGGALLANLSYVHRLLGIDSVLSVAWTLCIEVQFYLFFMVVLWVCQRMLRPGTGDGVTPWVMAGLGLLSLGVFVARPPQFAVMMTPYWCYFVGGYLCYVSGVQHRAGRLTAVYLMAFCLAVGWLTSLALLAGFAGMVGLTLAARLSRLSAWHGGRALQYLGRTSYSLYLIHMPVIGFVTLAGAQLWGGSTAAAVVWLLVAAVVSVLSAEVLYRLVEAPAIRAAARVRKVGGGSAGPGKARPVVSGMAS